MVIRTKVAGVGGATWLPASVVFGRGVWHSTATPWAPRAFQLIERVCPSQAPIVSIHGCQSGAHRWHQSVPVRSENGSRMTWRRPSSPIASRPWLVVFSTYLHCLSRACPVHGPTTCAMGRPYTPSHLLCWQGG